MEDKKCKKQRVMKIKNRLNQQIEENLKSSLIKVFGKDVLTEDELDEENENGINHVLELYKMHGNRKKALGRRVQVLRVLVRRLHNDKRLKMTEFEFNVRCEKYLDNLLSKYEYRVETAIDRTRDLCST